MSTPESKPTGRPDECSRCRQHQAMHFGDAQLCCWCHIAAGGVPADWHTVCMSEYRRLNCEALS